LKIPIPFHPVTNCMILGYRVNFTWEGKT